MQATDMKKYIYAFFGVVLSACGNLPAAQYYKCEAVIIHMEGKAVVSSLSGCRKIE